MSVLIKGMEMPTVGRILIVFPSGRVLEVSADATQNIFRETQSVPVPPHGRLIDADAMIHDIEKSAPMCSSWYVKERNADMIKFLSIEDTVIPAEEGE